MPVTAALFLRLGLAACFLGHGAVALGVHEPWLAFFPLVGIDSEAGRALMPVIGGVDIVVAVFVATRARLGAVGPRWFLRWALFWTAFTALLRPWAGGDAFDVLVRATNWGPALALCVPARFAVPALLGSLACIAAGVLGGERLLPSEPGVAQWLERGGLVGIPLALLELARWGKKQPPPHLTEPR